MPILYYTTVRNNLTQTLWEVKHYGKKETIVKNKIHYC